MKHYKTLVFDLDGTLAVSKSPLSPEMAKTFSKASQTCNLAVITGGMFEQIQEQVIDQLTADAILSNIFILPTSGSEMRLYNSETKEWGIVYSKKLSSEQRMRISRSLEEALETSSVDIGSEEILGEQSKIGNRRSPFLPLDRNKLQNSKLYGIQKN